MISPKKCSCALTHQKEMLKAQPLCHHLLNTINGSSQKTSRETQLLLPSLISSGSAHDGDDKSSSENRQRKKNLNYISDSESTMDLTFWYFPWSKPDQKFSRRYVKSSTTSPIAVGHLRRPTIVCSLKVSTLTPKTLSCLVIQFTLW